jgi:hypothetical protein
MPGADALVDEPSDLPAADPGGRSERGKSQVTGYFQNDFFSGK